MASRSAATSAAAASWRSTASRSVGDLAGRGLVALDGLAQLRDLAGGGLVAGDGLAQRVDLGVGRLVAGDDVAQLGDLRGGRHEVGVERLAQVVVGDGLAQRRDLVLERAHRLDAGAQRLGLALELVQAAAVVAGDRRRARP